MRLGDMDFALFLDIIDQLPDTTTIVPFFRGEPLLYPRFADAMERLSTFSSVQLATNGDYVARHREAIVESCTFVSLSLHEFRAPYHDQLFQAAQHRGVTTQVSIIDALIPDGKKAAFVSAWLQHVDRVRIYAQHTHAHYGDSRLTIHDAGQACAKPWSDMVVYWDGRVALCCHDWDNPGLADLNLHTVEEAWNGLPYKMVRHYHETGQRRKVKSCRHCDQWMAAYTPNGILGELYTCPTFGTTLNVKTSVG